MAVLINNSSGNFTAAGTWGLTSTLANSFLDSESGTTAVTTSNQDSASFSAVTTETWDGVALKISTISTAPSGTLTVIIRNTSFNFDEKTVTINASDLPYSSSTTAVPGWVFFKFPSAMTTFTGYTYVVRILSSVTSQVTLFTNGTAANWSRFMRSTTTQAPAVSDQLLILGDYTGAGTGSSYTVTMDSTSSATSYGSTTPIDSIHVSGKGTLAFGTSASTAYKLKYKGRMRVGTGGVLNIGTSGTRIPSTSTAELIMDSTANVDTGLVFANNATFNSYGNRKNNFWSLLTADLTGSTSTTATVQSTTDWLTNDEVGFAPTSRTNTQFEKRTITVTNSTQFTFTAITNSHSGTSPTQGEVVNLTRNVKIYGISTTLQGYIYIDNFTTANLDSVEMYNLGSGTSAKRGIDVVTTIGSFNIQYCSLHDFIVASSNGITFAGSGLNNVTVSNNVFYNINNSFMTLAATSGTPIISNNIAIGTTSSSGFNLSDVGVTFSSNRTSGAASTGVILSEAGSSIGVCSDNHCHTNNGVGFSFANIKNSTISNCTSWRNGSGGLSFSGAGNIFDTGNLFGNGTDNLSVGTGTGNVFFRNYNLNGDTSFATTNGFRLSTTSGYAPIRFDNCNFSTTSGIKNSNTNDININATVACNVILNNTILASSVEVTGQISMDKYSIISSQNHDQTVDNHRYWQAAAIGSSDSAIRDGASGLSERLTPSSSFIKCFSSPKQAAVSSGGTLNISVKVRCSVVGDGTAFNGNRPRLIVRANPALGSNFNSDTVLATATGASDGAFQTLSATTSATTSQGVMEFYVDGDGTTGWFNVDTWTIS